MLNNNEEILNIRYKISDQLEYEIDENHLVTIKKKQDFMIQNFFRKLKFNIPEYSNVSFDDYGSFIFLQVNGKRTVKEIGENLEARFGEEVYPLYKRLLLFLNHIDVNCHYIEKDNATSAEDDIAQ